MKNYNLSEKIGFLSPVILAKNAEDLHHVIDYDLLGNERTTDDTSDVAYDSFCLGYLAGIRAERERRKTNITAWKCSSNDSGK